MQGGQVQSPTWEAKASRYSSGHSIHTACSLQPELLYLPNKHCLIHNWPLLVGMSCSKNP